MIKFLLLIQFIPLISFSQQPVSTDSLSKYSYPIYGLTYVDSNDIHAFCGTGFFYKSSHNTYLITAKHVLTGCKPDGSKKLLPDTMKVVLENSFLNINIKMIKDTSVCKSIYDVSEVIAVPVAISKKESMNFISEEFNSKLSDVTAVKIYGYPKSMIFTDNFWQRKPANLSFDSGDCFITPTRDSATNKVNKLNYHIYLKNGIKSVLEGYSGSPIFFFNSKSNLWSIAGILISGGRDNFGDYLVMSRLETIHTE